SGAEISMIVISLTLVMALMTLKGSDCSVNVVKGGGLTLAIGRVMDESVVVVVIIYRRKTAYEIAQCLVDSKMCMRDNIIIRLPNYFL
ncbi:hypothetical protein GZ110_10250, partial [Staphylococcus aureus]|uniref:efflux RND transporter permease subunit n=1 Tax=Staphylococcus aureus TaxID=1280 RepID=UPI00139F288D|nr:hypothetical protein [Staphylococcus aureus]